MNNSINILGTGLLALDVILNGRNSIPPKIYAGGSCCNVLTILSFFGFQTYPISRLAKNEATDLILADLARWNVNTSFIYKDEKATTPIIIHRILKDNNGNPKHKFEFRNPSSGKWLPTYRSVLNQKVEEISKQIPKPQVFYFDRISRANITLAKIARSRGAVIIFEPSGINNINHFSEGLKISHILKYSDRRIRKYKSLFPNIQTELEIETLGKNGMNYRYRTNEWKTLNPYSINKVTDAAGAGDWCTAGIISRLAIKGFNYFQKLDRFNIENALNYGQALGALNCLFEGARGMMYCLDKSILLNNPVQDLFCNYKTLDGLTKNLQSQFENHIFTDLNILP